MDDERGSGFEQGGEYWKDIPDDILEELYKQLNNPGAQSIEAPEILSNDPFAWPAGGVPSNWGSLRHSGAVPENQFAVAGGSGFPTPPIKIDPTPLQVQPPPSQQVQAENNAARQTIEQIVNLHNTQEQQIEQMKQMQASLLTQPSPDASKLVQEQQWKLSQQIEAELKELHKLNKSVLLDHTNLHQTRVLAIRLQLQQHRIELLRQELQHLLAHGPSKCFAALVITEQPLPQVVFKGKMVEDAYSVLLITAAYQDIQALTKVKATLVSEEHNWKSVSPIENDTSAMDAFQRIALFHNIKVNVSTRMAPVHLKFGVQLQGQRTSQVVESTISYPLIVITNESQWCDAAGKLILADAFAGQAEVSWPQFANAIHHHFLKATRQDPSRPSRGLNEADWIYMHSRFFNNSPVVTQQQATAFWTYFGQVACTLRFKRHINSLWFTGLIYGFITKEECNAALLSQELGTFMIRFSESSPGLFAVAYVSDDPNERVKHYLVKHEDISSNKTLPDFLREKPQFQICYQLDPPSGTMRKFARDVLFAPYYSKQRKIAKESNGYVLL